MRHRLRKAVRFILDSPELADASDAVRLAAVVLLAKSPASRCGVRIRQAELGRWLGVGTSHIEHNVLPLLRRAGAVESRVTTDDLGQVTGLVCELTALRAAREGGGDHPLRLLRQDLATLLRLCEKVLGPGWAPKDGPVTEPGLLAGRQGPGAATDRLALLLLVLQTQKNGRASLVGGSVARGRGRCAATVAKVLGCKAGGGAKVLGRLVRAGVVMVCREEQSSGLLGKSRLLVPAVAAAHRVPLAVPRPRTPVGDIPGGAPDDAQAAGEAPDTAAPQDGLAAGGGFSEVEVSERSAGAVGDLEVGFVPDGLAGPRSASGGEGSEPGVVVRAGGAGLHALHAVVVAPDGVGAGLVGGCSGDAGGGEPLWRVRAREREDRPGPLRREQPVFASSEAVPRELAWVVEPVVWLWSRLPRQERREFLSSLVVGELEHLSGLVGRERAGRALRARFVRRMGQQGSVPVADPIGWMLSRGLRQRVDCWSELCDEGVRIDSAAACASCESERGESRAVRGAVLRDLAAGGRRVERGDLDAAVHHAVQVRAAAAAVRREGQLQLQVQAQAAAALQLRRDEARVREEQRLAVPCTGCGLPGMAGRCAVCGWRAEVVELLAEVVDLVVAGGGGERSAVERRLSVGLEQRAAESLAVGADEGEVAFARWTAARDLLEDQRREVRERLGGCVEVEAEVRSVVAAECRRLAGMGDAGWVRAQAAAAGDAARVRAAQTLLEQRVSAERGQRAAARERVDWGARLAGWAVRPLSEEVRAA
ncbi:hypothetical protein [Kitasatospora sp. NPDC058046]|uniref:hypothetical protein n=1 Tax=Kitasatospora sp. NPDC058046 TaxID=3346312 RepID=UPI0036D86F6B